MQQAPKLNTSRFSWTALPCFDEESLDQMILEVPPNTVFCGSMVLWIFITKTIKRQ